MIFGIEILALALAASTTTDIGEWEVTCTDSAELGDGMFDACTMATDANGLEVEIVRTAEGVRTRVRQDGCRPREEVPPAERSQEQLASENGHMMLLGTIMENLAQNQMACRARGGALAIPMTQGEATQLLEATSGIRGL